MGIKAVQDDNVGLLPSWIFNLASLSKLFLPMSRVMKKKENE